MSNRILLIVPTRSRPEKSLEFYESFKNNSSITDLLFGIDEDDVEYPRIPGVMYEVGPRLGLNATLNKLANKYANDYDYIAFMGDDNRIRTPNWDTEMLKRIDNKKNAIAYGNDLLQGERLPTAVLMDTNVIKTLGYMTFPQMRHLYMDNCWKELGLRLGTLMYFADIIIEHLHYSNGKSEIDELYKYVNSDETNKHDRDAFLNYVNNYLEQDVKKFEI